uniref:hypothetical protein n=1 Tax=Parasphingorhabdus sp. TaxID=2709688 RepID=UPI0035945710
MHAWLKNHGVALCAIAASLCLASGPAQADSLIENVNGMTLDSEGKVLRFTAMLVDDDGNVKE